MDLEDFSDHQLERYARHLVLPEIGPGGQGKLLGASALIIGAGGLGVPVATYLTAAGLGRIGLVDDDVIDRSNLQRQVLYGAADIGRPKVEVAIERLTAINPDVKLEGHYTRLGPDNALALFADYDVIIDGSDNFATRYLTNDAAFFSKRPLISAAVLRFDGQLSVFTPYLEGNHPCYRCFFGSQFRDPKGGGCADVGVMGAVVGVMGTLQAVEAIKVILGLGSLSGTLMLYDALSAQFSSMKAARDPACPLCGPQPGITDLSDPIYLAKTDAP